MSLLSFGIGAFDRGCTLMEVIFADRLLDYTASFTKTMNIATALMSNIKKSTFVISEEAWECNLKKLLRIKRGKRWWRLNTPESWCASNDTEEQLLCLMVLPTSPCTPVRSLRCLWH